MFESAKNVSHPGTLGFKRDEDTLKAINEKKRKCNYCGDFGVPTVDSKCVNCGAPKYLQETAA